MQIRRYVPNILTDLRQLIAICSVTILSSCWWSYRLGSSVFSRRNRNNRCSYYETDGQRSMHAKYWQYIMFSCKINLKLVSAYVLFGTKEKNERQVLWPRCDSKNIKSIVTLLYTNTYGHKVQQTISVQRRVGTSVDVITMDFLPLDSTGFS